MSTLAEGIRNARTIPERMPTAKVIEVIAVDFLRGAGVHPDPVRLVTAYYSLAGALLAENDSWTPPEANHALVVGPGGTVSDPVAKR